MNTAHYKQCYINNLESNCTNSFCLTYSCIWGEEVQTPQTFTLSKFPSLELSSTTTKFTFKNNLRFLKQKLIIEVLLTNIKCFICRRCSSFWYRYKEKFGFPFVICARENKKQAIINGIKTRLDNDKDKELATGITEVKKIAFYRLVDIVQTDWHSKCQNSKPKGSQTLND